MAGYRPWIRHNRPIGTTWLCVRLWDYVFCPRVTLLVACSGVIDEWPDLPALISALRAFIKAVLTCFPFQPHFKLKMNPQQPCHEHQMDDQIISFFLSVDLIAVINYSPGYVCVWGKQRRPARMLWNHVNLVNSLADNWVGLQPVSLKSRQRFGN